MYCWREKKKDFKRQRYRVDKVNFRKRETNKEEGLIYLNRQTDRQTGRKKEQ
jgi:hypothetical protein